MSTRPIDITSTSDTKTESMDISFIFNYPILTNQSFKARTISSDSTLGLNGLQVSLENITTKQVVLLNNVYYYFDSFYISKGADDTGTDSRYSIVIKNKSITDSNSNLYIIIPFDDNEDSMKDTPSDFSTLKSSINTYSNEISGNTNYINIGNLDLNLNSIINIDDTFYKYTINNDTIISLISGPVSLNMSDSIFSQFFKDIQRPMASDFKDSLVSESNNFPINMDLNVFGFQDDIYIDCSPVGSGTENEIIKPKKVFSVKPLINVDNIGDAGNALLFLFILIIIGVCFNSGIKRITNIKGFIDGIGKKTKTASGKAAIKAEAENANAAAGAAAREVNNQDPLANILYSLSAVCGMGIVLLFMITTISIVYTLANPDKQPIISNKTLEYAGIALASVFGLCLFILLLILGIIRLVTGKWISYPLFQGSTINTKNIPSIDWSKLSSERGSVSSDTIVRFLYIVLIVIVIAICVLVFTNSRFRSISTIQKAIFTSTFILIFGTVTISQIKDKDYPGISSMFSHGLSFFKRKLLQNNQPTANKEKNVRGNGAVTNPVTGAAAAGAAAASAAASASSKFLPNTNKAKSPVTTSPVTAAAASAAAAIS